MDWIVLIAISFACGAFVVMGWANRQINRELWLDQYLEDKDEDQRKKDKR